jgi:hypothetical protein
MAKGDAKVRELAIALALAAAAVLGGAAAVSAAPLPDIVEDLLEQDSGDRDHEVGEEMCAGPRARRPQFR